MDSTRVLVVDDDESMVKLLQAKLKAAGIEPNVAYSADEAIRKMTHGLYWVVVADIHMPGMSGVDLVSALKNLSPLVQVIMLTSDASVGRVIECVDRGAVDFISKSEGLDLLVETVTTALRRGARWIGQVNAARAQEPTAQAQP